MKIVCTTLFNTVCAWQFLQWSERVLVIKVYGSQIVMQIIMKIVKYCKCKNEMNKGEVNLLSYFFLLFRSTEFSVELNRFMERFYVESQAIDVESLCIVAGEKVG